MFDLFGEVVVTHDDLYAWVEAVAPAYTSSTRSFEHYVKVVVSHDNLAE